jgi:hypothetical protein
MEADTRVRLMRDLVVVQPDYPRKEIPLGDGLVLHAPHARAPQRGTVLGVGPKVQDLAEGHRVLYGRTAWICMLEGTLIFHERDILARIEPEEGDDNPLG